MYRNDIEILDKNKEGQASMSNIKSVSVANLGFNATL
jgi:hypothetical protein